MKACSGQGPLLLLVQTQAAKFGAYTDIGLENIGGYRKSKRAYLFGLTGNVPIICPLLKDKQHMA